MKKRTLWTALAVTFVVVAVVGPFTGQNQSAGDIVIGIIGCLAIAALFWWLRGRTDPEARFQARRKAPVATTVRLPDDYTSIDIETTGLDTQNDRIVELGAIRVRNGRPSGSFSQLVNPNVPIPEKTTEITGITANDVIGHPGTVQALASFAAFIGDDILLGHNIRRFDLPMIQAELARNGLPPLQNQTLDTLPLAQSIFPGERNRLVDLIRRLDIAQTESHRAADDALQTAEVYEKLKTL
ncbi:3'-5' exonuclease [Bifidobacterium animalis]|uniref:Exonuclease, DNA polymerase III, epsilon subunit family n=1 Tax=Bifidobacterium animalis subsp. lactis TaxID=302911 RepID=A0A8B3RIS1_BIFAN|nr:3'-5' exonuclease [Bifidobacterium animalis]RYM96096.1 exonuclease, DNA polymerase III, epsilon subunit family [Bifidobacterium animalis subsp. lactis]